jgi:hypothetical protein
MLSSMGSARPAPGTVRRRLLWALLLPGGLALGAALWKWQARRQVEEQNQQLQRAFAECSALRDREASFRCLLGQLGRCERLTILAVDPDMQPALRSPPGQTPPARFPSWEEDNPRSRILAQRDLAREESASLIELLRSQRFRSAGFCFLPHYALSCTIGQRAWFEGVICSHCGAIRYWSPPVPGSAGPLLGFETGGHQATELERALKRLLPHPQAAFFDKQPRMTE